MLVEINHLLTAKTRAELRCWLLQNSTKEKCCWVVVSILPTADTLLYLDVVEEALCFGWIDGVKKKISDTQLAQRLSPRSPKSSWTELNKARVRRLEKIGLMKDEGRAVLPNMDENAFVIDKDIEKKLKADKKTYDNFLAFPSLYKKIRVDTIQCVKNQTDLFDSRLRKFIQNTKQNKMYGQWNDNGRLIK